MWCGFTLKRKTIIAGYQIKDSKNKTILKRIWVKFDKTLDSIPHYYSVFKIKSINF